MIFAAGVAFEEYSTALQMVYCVQYILFYVCGVLKAVIGEVFYFSK